MSEIEVLLTGGLLLPLLAFVILVFAGARLGKPASGWVAAGAIAATTGLSALALAQWQGLDAAGRSAAQTPPIVWAHLGTIPISFGINLDSLTLIMFFMVSLVSACIFVFSIGYMAGHSDEIDGISKYHRFFAYLSLFCFSMLLLVIADSLLLLLIAWELVGLCSYLLIGYYFHRRSASTAAIKAFVTNRVGDFGFIIGLGMVFCFLGDFSLSGAAEKFRQQWEAGSVLFRERFLGLNLATWMGMLLFCGAIGKSAQFPLHVWLPDAMEGPTPVSALIHAATMVAAGVYLTARIFVLLTPEAQLFVAIIGGITLALGALVAIVQTDIKRVLAYSTVSQLGYMMLGLGAGAWIGALFHLLTHAFFKALMFLGSGQVIEGCHHEQDLRRMGGLWRKMPVTCATFLVGVLAIAGAGIPLLRVGLGGYFSKDEILVVSWSRVWGQEYAGLPGALFIVPALIAYVTPFYMMRCWWLAFMGQPRDPRVYAHAHESRLMYIPLVVLAAGTVLSGYVLFRPMVAEAVPQPFLTRIVDGAAHESYGQVVAADHRAHAAVAWAVGGAFAIGFVVAIAVYRRGLAAAALLAQRLRPLYVLLVKKFYFDEVYGAVLVAGTMALKTVCYAFDRLIIDGLVDVSGFLTRRCSFVSGNVLDAGLVDGAVNAVGQGTWRLGGLARSPQVGRIRNYILLAAGGLAAVVLWVAYR